MTDDKGDGYPFAAMTTQEIASVLDQWGTPNRYNMPTLKEESLYKAAAKRIRALLADEETIATLREMLGILVRENEELRAVLQSVHSVIPEVFINKPSPLTLEENTDVE